MKKIVRIIMAIIFLAGFNNTLQAQTNKKLVLNIQNKIGDKPLRLNDEYYTNRAGEKFNITTCNYFISNIKFTGSNGVVYVVPQDSSYFLIKENDPATKTINLAVPKGRYTAVTFTIGVDSLRSTTDLSQRKGALDISGGMTDGMYWTWNSGYLFLKLEGTCDQAKVDLTGQRKFRYHIGGFGGYNKPSINNIRIVTIDLSGKAAINLKNKAKATLDIQADLLKVFDGQNTVSIANDSSVMFGNASKTVSDNYAGMFSHVSTLKK
ncbi:MbnP family protein [Emticicia sp. C21]|uniref:MbnP family protein n=1 Tax=Emticicia sp. C21 TaxID=2302915 RepID=UPI000E90156C|nr:MbnP family protein [Emticicia sp. C21]RFS15029.1 hypothetical protein D0T08_18285 [Emticicia sp. C21]